MERARSHEPIVAGSTPPAPDWNWFWETVAFCPDFQCWPPRDMSGWCHEPFVATPSHGSFWPAAIDNGYGPACRVDNIWNGLAYHKGWTWQSAMWEPISGSFAPNGWNEWTVAISYSLYTRTTSHEHVLFSLYSGGTRWWKLTNWGGAYDDLRWNTTNPDRTFVCRLPEMMVNHQTYTTVVTSKQGDTRMYHDGKYVGGEAWGDAVGGWNLLYLAGQYQLKENRCMNGNIGPFVLSRHCWSPAQVAQYSENPYGFMGPAWEPQNQIGGQLACDIRTRPAVESDQRTRATVEGDQQTEATVEGDVRSRATVEGDIRTRPTVEGDVRTRRGR